MSFLPRGPSLNAIEFLVHDPCETPWWVYVKTAIPAAGTSLWMLIVPQPDEILEQYLDPSKTRGQSRRKFQTYYRRFAFPRGGPGGGPITGGGTGRGGGGGNGGGKGGGGPGGARRGKVGALLDSNTTIAEKLPGRQLFAGRQISLTEHVFWTGFNTLERVQWWFLIYSAGTNFIYEWASGIFEASCKFPVAASGRWHRNVNDPTLQSIAPVRENAWDRLYLNGEGVNVSIDKSGGINFEFFMNVTVISSLHVLGHPEREPGEIMLKIELGIDRFESYTEEVFLDIEANQLVSHTFVVTKEKVRGIQWDIDIPHAQIGGDVSFIAEVWQPPTKVT